MRFLCLITACAALVSAAQTHVLKPQPPGRQSGSPKGTANVKTVRGSPSVHSLAVWIPMRDGVRLAANVFLPSRSGRFPVILERTPYGKGREISPVYQSFVDRGYAVVAQDVRGRYGSEGVFLPLTQEFADGEDTLKWIAVQPWYRTGIGMIGGSYRGIVQWNAALSRNPHLKAIFPIVSGWDDYRDRFYSKGGAMKLGNRLEWMAQNLKVRGYIPSFNRYVLHLPIRTSDVAATGRPTNLFRQVVNHPTYDSFWRQTSVRERIRQIRIPVFSAGGWYDNFVESDLEAFAALRTTSGLNRLVVGPWPHTMTYKFPEADFGSEAMLPLRAYQLAWFDRWLMGKVSPLLAGPPLKIFVMGINRWREESEWPPEGAYAVNFYLSSAGEANTLQGDGELSQVPTQDAPPDRFVFDPNDPVPTRGGAVCCNPIVFPWGPMDQRPVERRNDVLVYTSQTLETDLEVIGPVRVTLYVSTSARDTDFTAKLVDVFPEGYARNLSDGILRLRYRDSLEKPKAAKPGQVYRVVIDAGVTANVFRKGHRIRLEISSSNFPRFDRNPNTGERIADEVRLLKASQTVFHDRGRPSQLTLMVMPPRRDALTPAAAPALSGSRMRTMPR